MKKTPLHMTLDSHTATTQEMASDGSNSDSYTNSSNSSSSADVHYQSFTSIDVDHYFAQGVERNSVNAESSSRNGDLAGVDLLSTSDNSLARSSTSVGELLPSLETATALMSSAGGDSISTALPQHERNTEVDNSDILPPLSQLQNTETCENPISTVDASFINPSVRLSPSLATLHGHERDRVEVPYDDSGGGSVQNESPVHLQPLALIQRLEALQKISPRVIAETAASTHKESPRSTPFNGANSKLSTPQSTVPARLPSEELVKKGGSDSSTTIQTSQPVSNASVFGTLRATLTNGSEASKPFKSESENGGSRPLMASASSKPPAKPTVVGSPSTGNYHNQIGVESTLDNGAAEQKSNPGSKKDSIDPHAVLRRLDSLLRSPVTISSASPGGTPSIPGQVRIPTSLVQFNGSPRNGAGSTESGTATPYGGKHAFGENDNSSSMLAYTEIGFNPDEVSSWGDDSRASSSSAFFANYLKNAHSSSTPPKKHLLVKSEARFSDAGSPEQSNIGIEVSSSQYENKTGVAVDTPRATDTKPVSGSSKKGQSNYEQPHAMEPTLKSDPLSEVFPTELDRDKAEVVDHYPNFKKEKVVSNGAITPFKTVLRNDAGNGSASDFCMPQPSNDCVEQDDSVRKATTPSRTEEANAALTANTMTLVKQLESLLKGTKSSVERTATPSKKHYATNKESCSDDKDAQDSSASLSAYRLNGGRQSHSYSLPTTEYDSPSSSRASHEVHEDMVANEESFADLGNGRSPGNDDHSYECSMSSESVIAADMGDECLMEDKLATETHEDEAESGLMQGMLEVSESDEESGDDDGEEDEDDFDANNEAFLPNSFLQGVSANVSSSSPSLDALLAEYDDDSESSAESEWTDSSGFSSHYSSDGSSDDDFSEDDEYNELMAMMSSKKPTVDAASKPAATPTSESPPAMAPMAEGLDLSMLSSLKSELQKVGQMIAFNKEGEKFVRRAHILASINNLATNIPSCVINHLGLEIREHLLKEEAKGIAGDEPHGFGSRVNMGFDLSDGELPGHIAVHDAGSMCGDSFSGDSIQSDGRLARQRMVRHSSIGSYPSSDSDYDSSDDGSIRLAEEATPRRRVVRTISGSAGSLSGNSMGSDQRSTTDLDSYIENKRPERRGSMGSSMSFSFSTGSTGSSSEGSDADVLPAIAKFEGALMFVDISGFTKLSTILDPEKLSKVINSYFQKIVEKVHEYDGDVQKFAGDALFAEWRVSPTVSNEDCVADAYACAAGLIKDCSNFSVLSIVSAQELIGSTLQSLNIHCGLGFGDMSGIHVGDSRNRREYLYMGDAIDQATLACDGAKLGEVVASREFNELLGKQCERIDSSPEGPMIVADTSKHYFDMSSFKRKVRNAKSRGVTEEVDGLEADALIEYRRLMSLYVHPVVVSNDVAAANDFNTSRAVGNANERHREEAELRSVYVMFIELELPVNLTGDLEEDTEVIHLANDVMNLVTKKLKHYSGHLRQFIVDDKGFVMIATFGLRGSTFPNLVAQRALPATLLIHQSLELDLGVRSKIGATFGDVYCGAVGGTMRHEYAVMGPSVNLAARLMHSPDNPGILVDNAVRQLAAKSYSFQALPAIKAKGYAEPVPIFVPLSLAERNWGTLLSHFVGRAKELGMTLKMAGTFFSEGFVESKFALVLGPSGMGKSSFLVHLIDSILDKYGTYQASHGNIVVSKHICLDSEMLVHFSAFRCLFLEVLKSVVAKNDDSGQEDSSSDLSVSTVESDVSELSVTDVIDVISALGREVKASSAAVNEATQYILDAKHECKKGQMKKQVAVFLVRAFLRCIEGSSLVVIAIDDIHFTDEVSWSILKRILESADNILLVGSSLHDRQMFRVSPYFWQEMDEQYAPHGRYIEIELKPLSEDEIVKLVSFKLNQAAEEVNVDLIHEVMLESAGMPQFANDVIDSKIEESGRDDSVSESTKQKFLSDIILHRVDELDVEVRGTLNIGAVLGETFSIGPLVQVLLSGGDLKEKDVRETVAKSLRTAVLEGILVAGDRNATAAKAETSDFDCNDDTVSFSFFKSEWRTTLLGLMLASRQRDVHRKTAESMVGKLSSDSSLADWLKLFGHRKSSGSTRETTEVALMIGANLKGSPQVFEAINVFAATLGMFGWENHDLDKTCGFSSDILQVLAEESVVDIISLSVGLGQVQEACNLHHESHLTFANAIRVMDRAKVADEIKDRSSIFPAYMGLSRAFSDGRIEQDLKRCYEQAMLYRLLEETRIHGRRIHHINALFLQMVLFARLGELEKAIAAHSVIRSIYKPIIHTAHLRTAYGVDTGAASFSLCSFLCHMQGNSKQALLICKSVLKRVIPIIEPTASEAFLILYPLLFLLKEEGYACQAKQILNTVLRDRFGTVRVHEGSEPYYGDVIEPLTMLLSLAAGEEMAHGTVPFVMNLTVVKFGSEVNCYLGRLGRCGDSILAEICLYLSRKSTDVPTREAAVRHGLMVSSFAASFNRRQGLRLAFEAVERIRSELRQSQLQGSD